MATSSILKNVNIRGKKQIKDFVNALEKAEKFKGEEVHYGRTFEVVKEDDVKKIFGAKLCQGTNK